jgi:hypothetical protein
MTAVRRTLGARRAGNVFVPSLRRQADGVCSGAQDLPPLLLSAGGLPPTVSYRYGIRSSALFPSPRGVRALCRSVDPCCLRLRACACAHARRPTADEPPMRPFSLGRAEESGATPPVRVSPAPVGGALHDPWYHAYFLPHLRRNKRARLASNHQPFITHGVWVQSYIWCTCVRDIL